MTNLFLFDFDGVLVDSLALYEHSVKVCLERIGKPPSETREEFLDLFEDNFYRSIAKRGIDVDAFMAASKAVTPTLDYDSVRPVAGLDGVLAELRKRHGLVIISSNSSFAIRLMLARFGYEPYFDDVLGADVNFSKVEKILYAKGHYGMDARRTLYICDTAGDVREAREAGVRTVAVTWGWHPRERLERACPDVLIDKPEDLLRFC
ncbi:MAG: HAD family hydrolase [Pseudomonadota bacterium]|jgi:phosphoglycolate phosphatase|nr:HAD family hydrolase [Syntrophaceae bacterium]MBP7033187.1 HAD family hydrolase [Syntrophobacterales bacterium]MDI9554653.1 HAD family hydrolase [Pseudomonadota bacterium]NLX30619.1 HAD family hydrolase [Deltaproteobacteria bacterium]HNU86249.1 HAD family hydrolase [Syntrophales bacterium]